MPRPKKDNKLVQYTIMLDPNIIKEIKTMAKKADLPAATLARNILMIGLDDARIFDKVGLLRLLFNMMKKIIKDNYPCNIQFSLFTLY